ncbi:hypothetical protein GCM10027440_19590 [Nocardiopsis coralliicola]
MTVPPQASMVTVAGAAATGLSFAGAAVLGWFGERGDRLGRFIVGPLVVWWRTAVLGAAC